MDMSDKERIKERELHNLYSSLIIVAGGQTKQYKLGEACSMNGEIINAYTILVVQYEVMGSLVRRGQRLEARCSCTEFITISEQGVC